MNFIDRLFASFGYRKAAAQYPDWSLADAGVEKWSIPQDGSVYGNQADLYRRLSWIATAIEITANTCAAQPFGVMQVSGEDEKEIKNHDFERLLYNPNPAQSRFEFLVSTFAFYKLTGNAYWWLNATGEGAAPAEIWVIPTNMIVPLPDERMFLRGYRYDPGNGQEIILEPWEICHFKRYNPNSMFVGLSPIEAISTQAQSDIARVEWDYRLYKDENGRLPGILAFADPISDPEWEKLKRESRNKANKREMLMLRGVGTGGVNWIEATMSNTDMQFIEQRTATKEEIFGLFAPGLASVLAVNATEANAKSGKATFAEFSLWPALDNIAQKITKQILPLYGDNLKCEFEDPRTKDRVLEMQEQVEYSKTHTVAEVRKKFYKDEPLGDDRDNLFPVQVNAQTGDGTEKPIPPALQPFTGQPVPEQPQEQPQPEQQEVDNPEEGETEAYEEELVKWRRKALTRLREGKPAAVEFTSDRIPRDRHDAIYARLALATDAAGVKAAFAQSAQSDLVTELRKANELLERALS